MKYFKFKHPDLVKFCPEEFNIKKGCNTLRFGTLYDFRKEENEKLRDAGEGTFKYTIEFPRLTKVSREWLECFETEGGPYGEAAFGVSHLELKGTDVYVERMDMLGSCPNCWIYCISTSSENAGNISETHLDKWLIPYENIKALQAHFAALIWNEIKYEDLPVEITNQYTYEEIKRRLDLKVEFRSVEYTSRTHVVKDASKLSIPDIHELMDKTAFTKPPLFEAEREVRMAFWLLFDGKKISISNNTKIINLRPIDKILTSSEL